MTMTHDEAVRVHKAGIDGRRAWTAWDGVTLEEHHATLELTSQTPHTRFNAVVRTDHSDAESLDDRIVGALGRARERGVRLAWWVDADVSERTASDLPARLESAGFAHRSTLRAMVADTRFMDTRIKTVRAFSCRPVETRAELETWARTVAIAYDFDDRITDDWLAMHEAIGYDQGLGWRHHLARSGDEVVGCASAFVQEDNVSVSHVTTLPDFRGASVGTAATISAIAQTRDAGIRHATLYAPLRAAPLYQRIGFQSVGTLDVFEHAPA
jgi:GNAT superfamily N-acetyltransferase